MKMINDILKERNRILFKRKENKKENKNNKNKLFDSDESSE